MRDPNRKRHGISRKDVQWHSGVPEGTVRDVDIERTCGEGPVDSPGVMGRPWSRLSSCNQSVESQVMKWLLCWVTSVMLCERRLLC